MFFGRVCIVICLFQVICGDDITDTEVECPLLPELENGHYEEEPPNIVRPICNNEYNLIGSTKLRCVRRKWIPIRFPRCLRPEDECPELAPVDNAETFYDGRRVGMTIAYHCHDGHYITGDRTRTCTEGRYWSGLPPSCLAKLIKPESIVHMLEHHIDPNKTEPKDEGGRILGKEVFDLGLDLFFLMDRSSSIDPVDFNYAKNFVKKLIRIFKGNENRINGTRIHLTTFADVVKVEIALNNETFNSVNATLNKIDQIEGEGGGTAMEPAFSSLFDYLMFLRPNVKKALFLLTDGEPNVYTKGNKQIEPEEYAKDIKNMGFEIYCIGVGKEVSRERLTKIASKPSKSHVLLLETYKTFDEVLDIIQKPMIIPPPPPLPGPDACGYLGDDEIESSYEKNSLSHPWLAAIYVYKMKTDELRFCSGVVVTRGWILTSAICVQAHKSSPKKTKLQVTVVLGAQELSSAGLNFYATDIVISPLHVPQMLPELRLALLKLDRNIPASPKYRPICLTLPKASGVPLEKSLANSMTIEGWGSMANHKTQKKLSLNGSYVSPKASRVKVDDYILEKDCVKYLLKKYKNDFMIKNVTDRFHCVGSRDEELKIVRRKPSTCSGNYGSPLIVKDPITKRYTLEGIQTSKFGCSDVRSVFLMTAYYVNWIDRVTSKNHTEINHL